MHPLLKNFRLVELDCFYDLYEHETAAQIFQKVLQLKLRGYRDEYPYGVLPLDTSDFVSIHYALCKEENGQLTPVMAHRSISTPRCELHKMRFPVLQALGTNPEHDELREEVQAIVDRARHSNIPILYGSCWTIDPEIRSKNRELVLELRNIFAAINTFQSVEAAPAELVTCGVKRFKTEKFFEATLGYREVGDPSRNVCTFKHPIVFGEEVAVMHSTGVPQAGLDAAEAYRALWENRLVLHGPRPASLLERQKKAA